MRRPIALSTLLAAVLGGIVLSGVAAAGLAGWLVVRDLTRELLAQRAIQAIGRLEQGLREHLAQAEHDVTSLARLLEEGRVPIADAAALEPVLRALLAGHDELTGIGVVALDGTVTGVLRRADGTIEPILQPPGSAPDPMQARRLAQAHAAAGVVWSEPIFGGRLGEAVLLALHAVRRDGAPPAMVTAGISVGRLSALVETLSGNGEARPFVLLGDRVLAHPLLRLVPTGSRREPLEPVARFADPALRGLGDGERLASYPGTEGRELRVVRVVGTGGWSELVLSREIEGFGAQPWTVGLVVPEMAIHPLLMPLRLFGLLAAVIALVALLLAIALGRRLAGPVVRVTSAVERVSSLELDALGPLPASRIAELDALSRAFNAMLATLKAFATYVPKSLVERLIKAGRPDAVPSRERDLAVMFTDIQGFTGLSESLPPAEVARLLNEHFALLARCVEDEGGTVDKYLGDGMLAFWGAPEKIKNRALRACRAALAIRRAVEADNARRRERGEPPLRVRIGLHRGPLVVGNIGAPGRLNYTVVGDTVNTAQRLMELARPLIEAGADVAIVASPALAEETRGAFVLEPIGTLTLRGREQPVTALSLRDLRPLGATAAPAPETAPAPA